MPRLHLRAPSAWLASGVTNDHLQAPALLPLFSRRHVCNTNWLPSKRTVRVLCNTQGLRPTSAGARIPHLQERPAELVRGQVGVAWEPGVHIPPLPPLTSSTLRDTTTLCRSCELNQLYTTGRSIAPLSVSSGSASKGSKKGEDKPYFSRQLTEYESAVNPPYLDRYGLVHTQSNDACKRQQYVGCNRVLHCLLCAAGTADGTRGGCPHL